MSLWTISLVTQILCLALVTGFVALRGVVAWRFKKGVDVEDGTIPYLYIDECVG